MLLKDQQINLFKTTSSAGFPGRNRHHDLFIKIEAMTPEEYKNGGENLLIRYSYCGSHFGDILVASTFTGICYMAFSDNQIESLNNLKKKFPNAGFENTTDFNQQNAISIFKNDWGKIKEIKLHLKGTQFQLKVWKTLLKIPMGQLSTYGSIAKRIENPKASRAVGTAIASNPVAYLIPCHRIIQASGAVGEYMWGKTRKAAIIEWEASKINVSDSTPEPENK